MYCLAYRYCFGLFEKKTESREKTRHRKKKGGVRRTLHERKKIVSKFITSFDLLVVVVWLMNLYH